ncbi:nucleotidyltransferase family protein [Spirosoma aureum]|uniref:Nucleotidyltransferase family protein n=1 Tax=Spirosoma aureum TaxID=2692134 RepID=A0A6G9AST7_9BACT|nr:nucleotidyltransferase family protein [Spirosoma aureum]QIP15389.1 nucleotidyltransferase family protein [Spirosoma aureum]
MMPGRTPEIVLLQMACTIEPSIEKKDQINTFLAQTKINWNRLYTLAERHRLTPFLYNTIQSLPEIPAKFLAALRASYQASTTDGMLKIHHYRLLDKLLTDHAIAHIAYKGIYLAEHCYPNGNFRISGDLDVLVSVADAFKTTQLLEKHQYRLNKKHKLYYEDGEQRLLTELSEISLFKLFYNDSYFDVDLHWKILCFNKDFASFDLNYILSHKEFQNEIQVVLLVTHHGVTNIWQQLYYINDLYFLLNNRAIDWAWLMQEMHRYGMERIFLVGLYWCQKIWNLTLQTSIQQLVDTPGVHKLADSYEKNWESNEPVALSRQVLDQFIFFLKAQTRLKVQAKICITFLTSRVFRASTFKIGKKLIYIPKELGFLTVFIRALRSMYKFLPASH